MFDVKLKELDVDYFCSGEITEKVDSINLLDEDEIIENLSNDQHLLPGLIKDITGLVQISSNDIRPEDIELYSKNPVNKEDGQKMGEVQKPKLFESDLIIQKAMFDFHVENAMRVINPKTTNLKIKDAAEWFYQYLQMRSMNH